MRFLSFAGRKGGQAAPLRVQPGQGQRLALDAAGRQLDLTDPQVATVEASAAANGDSTRCTRSHERIDHQPARRAERADQHLAQVLAVGGLMEGGDWTARRQVAALTERKQE